MLFSKADSQRTAVTTQWKLGSRSSGRISVRIPPAFRRSACRDLCCFLAGIVPSLDHIFGLTTHLIIGSSL